MPSTPLLQTTAPLQPEDPASQQKLRMRSIVLSFAVGLALMGLKFLTYHLTQSSAVLSDALESIINVAASAFAAQHDLLTT
jgi:divalent metal cation (Fe/Co/Zn/Cd) transporter